MSGEIATAEALLRYEGPVEPLREVAKKLNPGGISEHRIPFIAGLLQRYEASPGQFAIDVLEALRPKRQTGDYYAIADYGEGYGILTLGDGGWNDVDEVMYDTPQAAVLALCEAIRQREEGE